jgi:putative N6-adenine-specific DNA methylase
MILVTCTSGLESALRDELRELGFEGRIVRGGVETQGDHMLINLWSRIASRVLVDGEDSSGELLHFRGYRQEIGKAPMRETLAAGMLRLAKWEPQEPLWDLMCGSGTLLIEAALIAHGTAPGAHRHFAFEKWRGAERFSALPKTKPARACSLRGTDLNAGALGVTRRNATRAGVLELLTLERADATKVKSTGPKGLVVANLPYGKRVKKADLTSLIENLRENFSGWRFAFLMQGELDGLRPEASHPLSNGGLRCSLHIGVC